MRVELYRHGKTDGNAKRHYVGSTNEELSAQGLAELRALPPDESVTRLFSSPMRRVIQTAEILFPKAEIIPVNGLEEMDFGVFEGRSEAEMADDAQYAEWTAGGRLGRCPNGETRGEYMERSSEAFASLVRQAAERGEQRLVIVAHGGTVMSVCTAFALPRRDYFDWMAVTPNAGCWVFDVDAEAWLAGRREMTILKKPATSINYDEL